MNHSDRTYGQSWGMEDMDLHEKQNKLKIMSENNKGFFLSRANIFLLVLVVKSTEE